MTFSDERLTAYLDGETDAATTAAIDAAAKSDPAVAERLDALTLDTGVIAEAFGSLLDTAPPADPIAQTAPPRWAPVAAMAAMCLLALGIGWSVGHRNTGAELDRWQDYAAAYHRLYVEETLAEVAFPAAALDAQIAQVSDAISTPLPLEALQNVAGLTLKRAQVLGKDGDAIAHIAFVTAQGDPVALCISRDGAADMALRSATLMGLATESWSDGGVSYLLIGGSGMPGVEDAAKRISSLL